jgi:hypothetical protein
LKTRGRQAPLLPECLGYLNNATTISYTLPTGPTAMFVRLRVTQP